MAKPKKLTIARARQQKKWPLPLTGVPSRNAMYGYTAPYSFEAIDVIIGLMRNKQVDHHVRLKAAAIILNKSMPDLKALEVSGEIGEKRMIVLKQYGPGDLLGAVINGTPVPNTSGSPPLQGSQLAPQSPQDLTSAVPASTVGTVHK